MMPGEEPTDFAAANFRTRPYNSPRLSSGILAISDWINSRVVMEAVPARGFFHYTLLESATQLVDHATHCTTPIDLDSDAFVAEVKKVRGKQKPLSAAALKHLRDEHAATIDPARVFSVEALTLERELSDLVNAAYHLTPAEVALMWQTAPPRMPLAPPHRQRTCDE